MTTCSVVGCQRKHRALGLCMAHWERQRYGRPLEPPIGDPHGARPLIDRLSEKLLQGDPTEGDDAECWEWIGGRDNNGYAHIWTNGKARRAHRILYELLIGPIPEGLQLNHWTGCKCPSPFHCYIGTQGQNVIDDLLKETAKRDLEREAF